LAPLPRPIGIDRTLTDIATGLGHSARLLPALSQSDIGAVAVKAAKVRLEFQMARSADKSSSDVTLGVKTFSVSAAQVSQSASARASSSGVIELEIVAVALGDRAEPVLPKPPADDRQREAIVRAIALLRMPEASGRLGTADRKIFEALLKEAEAALAEGELAAAAAALGEIERLLAKACGVADPLPRAVPAAPKRATRVLKKAPRKSPKKKG
jgi:hypothetical protein